MQINGQTAVYGIFGYPVRHSLSPRLHNRVFEKRGRNAVYVPFEVRPDYFGEALAALRSLDIRGVNVTLPHKEAAARMAEEVPSDVDRAIGAVNTIVVAPNALVGHNTDGPAFLEELKEELGFSPEGKAVLLVGAGGAARAAAFHLLKERCGRLLLHNRTPERARGLADYLGGFFPKADVAPILSVEDLGGQRLDLIVNASSCGMKPEDPFPVNPDVLAAARAVYDLVYLSGETKLVREARRRGLQAAGGGGMLVRQAVLAHLLWFPDAKKPELQAIMREEARACGI